MNNRVPEVEINHRIRDKEIRLIDENGDMLGVMPTVNANRLADERNLDLVKISPHATPPVCKLMDYNKYKFEKSKKDKELKKNQKLTELKEIRLSMTIDPHDVEHKAKFANEFLLDGHKVAVSIRMRGRQQAHARLGYEIMEKFYEVVSENSVIDKAPTTEGRSISMILAPKK